MIPADALRIDVLLHRLCLTRSRNEARIACDSGAVLIDAAPVRPSRMVTPGSTITIRFPGRTMEITVDELPAKSTSRKRARELYRIVAESAAEGD